MKSKRMKELGKLLRDQRLEREKMYGKLRSKTWNRKPTSKQDRKKNKQYLNNLLKEI
jgi:hypothetical protein